MINFTKQLDTGVSATFWRIANVAIDNFSDAAKVRVLGWIDKDHFDAQNHFVDAVEVDVTGILELFPTGESMFEQLILALPNSPFTGGTQA